MNAEQLETLEDIRDSLRELARVAKGASEPTQSILTTQIFIIVQKVKFLLGKGDE